MRGSNPELAVFTYYREARGTTDCVLNGFGKV
jgi:hypothetical protein